MREMSCGEARARVEDEMDTARAWRAAGNEGRARLCVRVTEVHRLPHLEDPLEDAQLVIDRLGPTLTSQSRFRNQNPPPLGVGSSQA
jgi:hypothetical protein